MAGWFADLVAGLRACWMDGWLIAAGWAGLVASWRASKVVGWRAGMGGYFEGLLDGWLVEQLGS